MVLWEGGINGQLILIGLVGFFITPVYSAGVSSAAAAFLAAPFLPPLAGAAAAAGVASLTSSLARV